MHHTYIKVIIASWQGLSGNARGSLWLLTGGLFATVMITGIKFAGQRLPVLEILFMRQLFLFIMLTPILAREFPGAFRTKRLKLHFTRCAVSIVAMVTGFTAIVHLPLAEATAISFSRALFATVLAVLILKELVGIRRWGATLVGFLGVLIIVQPSSDGINAYALLAIVSAALVSCNLIMTKKLTTTEKPKTIMAYHAGLLTIAYAGPCWWLWVEPTWPEVGLIIGLAGLMSAVQYCIIRGYRDAEASAAQPLEYVRLLYAAAIGFLVFAEIPTTWTWVGAALIIASSLYTMKRNVMNNS
ncbi:DMT family transporter [Rhodospirillaceae bacterium]|mgnify:FL=1|nr:DMT family transporter [Rhodospirillaceae bacterium]MBT6305377.1 DMT family transporter [Rhodospirillaceae bacterium]MDC0999168.1 DMT family transporter [Alphaproteobacteria bacterium]MDC1442278.1 DMT family transporter [Rhodospirillaceae bacterium]